MIPQFVVVRILVLDKYPDLGYTTLHRQVRDKRSNKMYIIYGKTNITSKLANKFNIAIISTSHYSITVKGTNGNMGRLIAYMSGSVNFSVVAV